MKGRDRFSQREAAPIRELLEQKIKSGNLKLFRDKLRRLGFYSSDFRRVSSGFTREDFDQLVRIKRIEIYEDKGNV